MVVFPPAKINLGLHVTGKREDGYHNLETVFYPLPFTDILEVNLSGKDQFTLSGEPVEGEPAANLCMKALRLIRERVQVPPLNVHLHKVIPPGSGLGAGSSDAAYMLRAVNELCETGLDQDELLEMALSLGSDCPFFINPRPMAGKGRGESLVPIEEHLKGWFIAVMIPGIHISTALAFASVSVNSGRKPPEEILNGFPVSEWKNHLINDFEQRLVQEYPQLGHLKHQLLSSGAEYAAMSGTGSAVFGLFREEPQIKASGHMKVFRGRFR